MISISNVSKQYGGQILFVEASFFLGPGEKVGLVGPNGAGKSTIFRLITGEEQPDDGIVDRPKRITIGYFRQDVGDLKGRSVLAETLSGAGEAGRLGEELKDLEAKLNDHESPDFADAVERYGEVQARFQELGGYDLEARAQAILAGLGFSPAFVAGDVGNLSGGWKMRVALAQILLARPEVLLLDEPTNYLDIESILWLEGFLRDYQGAVLMTCHDRDVMNRVVKKIIEIDAGDIKSYSGDYEFYEAQRAIAAAQYEAQYERQQAMLAKEKAFIERFKARASHAAQVQSRVKKLDKIEKIEPPRRVIEKTFDFKKAARSGDDVIKVEGVAKKYGEKVVHGGTSLLVRRNERWAVMGENGSGKTTLLKMIAGGLTPDAGAVGIGASVTMGYFAQHQMEQLSADRTVIEELVAHSPTTNLGTLRSLAGAFGFHGDDHEKPIRILSGGEKARLALAKILFDAPNLLVLDEPTNHLDIVTKRALVKALATYEGTIVFVSHDRNFLRAIATRVLELSKDGPRVYGGTYDEYVSSTGREAPGMRQAQT
ncbi:ATP-binding protein of ABC transporter [Labilithrix luteola]|uniref:Probable ATP-binding protein YbiT n=1 Tax=Labilithrix luteola TaxID=1391654 RepID=A0A0K1PLG8_9BACT|nr:ABC-F family ATP-binding cassette domain-containing protein [Labilithrix luteola]AKU94370.1 ATP-binding protein of ABC transporter [Labilithrix luteola]